MYEFGDFKDPIDSACSDAYGRMSRYALGASEFASDDDMAVEHIESISQDAPGDFKIYTRAEYFSCGFSGIHDEILRQPNVPDYLNDIIAGMVRAIVSVREESEGNQDITLLMPARETLAEFVENRWHQNEMARWEHSDFWVYAFMHKGSRGKVVLRFDETSNAWNLGYTLQENRLLLRWGRNIYEETDDGTLIAEPIAVIQK